MRILGFEKKWPKLDNEQFTTFRLKRQNKDWQIGEIIQVVVKPRSPKRVVLGTAAIINKEKRNMNPPKSLYNDRLGNFYAQRVTLEEAITDGFDCLDNMYQWFLDIYGNEIFEEPMNKLTLRWEVKG